MKGVLTKDESDLFYLANKFGIRHRRNDQRTDCGEEFLDYIFSAFLSAILLMEAVGSRQAANASQSSMEPVLRRCRPATERHGACALHVGG